MKKCLYITLALLLTVVVYSCKDQDDVYKQWVKPGGYIYPEKANGLSSKVGAGRVILSWAAPKDLSVEKAVITWSNGDSVRTLNYSDYEGQDSIHLEIKDLKEQAQTFSIVNYDHDNNVSMEEETTATPYGPVWLSTHSERSISSIAVYSGTDAAVSLNTNINEMIATRFRYVNTDGDTIVSVETAPAWKNTFTLPNAKPGTRYQYSSSYCPSEGLDTIWNSWNSGATPIAGKLAHTNWSVTAPGYSNGYPPENAIDGVITGNFANSWWWNNATYPKIFVVDLGNDNTYVNMITLYQNNTNWYNGRTLYNVELYCGNEKFDVNAGSDYANTSAFKNAVFKHTSMVFWNSTAYATWNLGDMYNFRYFCFVIKNSRRNGSSINEIDAYGYDTSAQ